MHLILIIGIVLLPKAYTLQCYECIPGASGSCTETPKECPAAGYQCGAHRVITYRGSTELSDINTRTCVLAEECRLEDSINFGVVRTVVTTKCCTTALCNNQPAPAYTLQCYECIPGTSGSCTDTPKECPAAGYQCGALRLLTYTGSTELNNINTRTCVLPEQCVDGSINFGVIRVVITSNCCTTALCNNQPAPEPSKTNPNGKKCFFCDGQSCTATLNCEGDEDHCVSTTENTGGQTTTLKGCASKVFCQSAQTAELMGNIVARIDCCQGDYCNSASTMSTGLLLLLAPIISLFVFS